MVTQDINTNIQAEKDRKNILYLDDDINLQRAFRLILKPQYNFHSVFTLKNALSILENEPIDLLIVDHILPDGRGIDLLEATKQEGVFKPTIVVTAHPDEGIMHKYNDFSFVKHFLVKPVDPSLLQFVIKTILNPNDNQSFDLYDFHKQSISAEFSQAIIHEINNYLTSLMGYLELWKIKQGNLSTNESQSFKIIMDCAHSIHRLIQQFKNIGKPYDRVIRKVEVNEVINSSLDLALVKFKNQIEINLNLNYSIPQLLTNPDLLTQVIFNLLLNSFQAMEVTGGTLTITTTQCSDSEVVISIEDTGEGISDESIHKIFEPFYSTKKHGTGLGMYVVKNIIEQLGGKVLIESQILVGTTVKVILPIENQHTIFSFEQFKNN